MRNSLFWQKLSLPPYQIKKLPQASEWLFGHQVLNTCLCFCVSKCCPGQANNAPWPLAPLPTAGWRSHRCVDNVNCPKGTEHMPASAWKCIARCYHKVSLLDLAHSISKRKINLVALPEPLPWLQKVNSSLNGSCLCLFPHENTLPWGGLHFPFEFFCHLPQNRLWPALSDWWRCSGKYT